MDLATLSGKERKKMLLVIIVSTLSIVGAMIVLFVVSLVTLHRLQTIVAVSVEVDELVVRHDNENGDSLRITTDEGEVFEIDNLLTKKMDRTQLQIFLYTSHPVIFDIIDNNRIIGIENNEEVFFETEIGVAVIRRNAYLMMIITLPVTGLMGALFGFLTWKAFVRNPQGYEKRTTESQDAKPL